MVCRMVSTNLEVRTNGSVSPCCVSDFVATDSHGTAMTIHNHSIEDIITSDSFATFASDIEDGKKRPECNRCWKVEESGGKSKRQIENERVFEHPSDNVKSLDIKPGNICNLKCRICSSYASSRWIPDEKKISSTGQSHFPKFAWADEDPDIFLQLLSKIDDVEYIEFSGGEPFLIQAQWKFINTLVESGLAEKIHIQYHTNGTIFPDEEIATLEKFKKCTIVLSIDGIGSQFEYQRFPANWEVVYNNWKKFLQTNLHVSISHSVSSMNVLYYPEFVELCNNLNTEVYLNLVDNKFPIHGLSDWTKNEIITILNEKLPDTALTQINPVTKDNNWLAKVMLDSPNRNNNQEFLQAFEMIDDIRNQSFAECFPDVYNLLKKGINE